MRTALTLAIILLLPLPSSAHPGKTDYRGGHKCWSHCEEWELLRGEYHLHDQDGKPVRLAQKESLPESEQPKEVPTPEKHFLQEGPSEPAVGAPVQGDGLPEQGPPAVRHEIVTVYEEGLLSIYSILLGLLAFLMLLVLIFVRKKKEGG